MSWLKTDKVLSTGAEALPTEEEATTDLVYSPYDPSTNVKRKNGSLDPPWEDPSIREVLESRTCI